MSTFDVNEKFVVRGNFRLVSEGKIPFYVFCQEPETAGRLVSVMNSAFQFIRDKGFMTLTECDKGDKFVFESLEPNEEDKQARKQRESIIKVKKLLLANGFTKGDILKLANVIREEIGEEFL